MSKNNINSFFFDQLIYLAACPQLALPLALSSFFALKEKTSKLGYFEMPENKKQRVLIIGAGLTGLSLGVQLLTHAAAYYEPVIFEKVIITPPFFLPIPSVPPADS